MFVSSRLVVVFALVFMPVQAMAADAWDRWLGEVEDSQMTVDHGDWNDLLVRYIQPDGTGLNRFAYGNVSDDDKKVLDGYLANMAKTDPLQLARNGQMVYWINLYNALTVKVILDHYPVDSIKDIRPGFFTFHPWDKKWMQVQGEAISLNDIEHRILRPIFKDNRVHYAINCASVGCPNLQAKAWTTDNLETMLDAAAREYVNSSRGVWKDANDKLMVSSIYHWFDEDFGDSKSGVITHIRPYADARVQALIKDRDEYDSHDYDWSLNDAVAE